MLVGMLSILFKSTVSRYILIFALATSSSPSWAASGIGDWSQRWGNEIDLVEAQLLLKKQDCGLTEELFLELGGLAQLKRILSRQQSLVLNIAEKPKDKRWFLIASGEQPSGGYGLSFEGLYAYAEHKELSLIWTEPQAGYVYTQALVSPCLLIELSAEDRLPILVVDHEGNKRHRFSVE